MYCTCTCTCRGRSGLAESIFRVWFILPVRFSINSQIYRGITWVYVMGMLETGDVSEKKDII